MQIQSRDLDSPKLKMFFFSVLENENNEDMNWSLGKSAEIEVTSFATHFFHDYKKPD